MRLTDPQKATFKTWLLANANGLSETAAAALANTAATPTYLAWMSSVPRTVVQAAAAFDWTRVDNLSVGKARIWDWMFNAVDYINPWRGNIRTGINAVWVGTAQDLAVRDAANGACQRAMTNFEKLYTRVVSDGPSQTGARGSFTNADLLGLDADGNFIEGTVSAQMVSDILAGP